MTSVQTTPARPALLESPASETATVMDFVARWPDLPESMNLDMRDVAAISNSYADTQGRGGLEEQMPSTWPVFEAVRAGQRQDPASEGAFGSALLAGALALASLLLAGGAFRLARRTREMRLDGSWRPAVGLPGPRRSVRADLTDLADRSSAETPQGLSVWQVPRPTDPAHDLKTSLGELRADLQRARAASYSHRSFAPPPRQANKRAALKKQVPLRC
jgi:hypothetical protein